MSDQITHIPESIKKIVEESKAIINALNEGDHYFQAENKRLILKKAGAEIIAKAYGFTAKFSAPQVVETIPGNPTTVHAISMCSLEDKKGAALAEGAGAYGLKFCQYNLNTAAKMAAKSAFIDAVIRAAALSAVFSQDIEDDTWSACTNVDANNFEQDSNTPIEAQDISPDEPEKAIIIEKIKNIHPNPQVIPVLFGEISLEDMSISELNEALAEINNNDKSRSSTKMVNGTVKKDNYAIQGMDNSGFFAL